MCFTGHIIHVPTRFVGENTLAQESDLENISFFLSVPL